MKKIYKYILKTVRKQNIFMSTGAKILSVQSQKGQICIWAIVDTDDPCDLIEHEIYIEGTGYLLIDDLENYRFLSTVQILNGNLVWHVFIKKQVKEEG